MAVIGFKKQFKQPIIEGTKVHTIRYDEKDLWHAGRKIHMATGVRTRQYDCFKQGDCKSTQVITMSYYADDDFTVKIDGRRMTQAQIAVLIANDGFKCQADFVNWFFADRCLYKGKLIHWTDLKY